MGCLTLAHAGVHASATSSCAKKIAFARLRLGTPLVACASLAIAAAPSQEAQQEAGSGARSATRQVIDQSAISASVEADPVLTEPQLRTSLARSFAQSARQFLQRGRVFIGSLETARELLTRAVALAPDDEEIWRMALDLGSVLEEGDPIGAKLGADALVAISRLDPEDEGVRLRRLLGVMEERQTAEARIAVALQILAPDSIPQIGPRVAARIAYELASLYKRTGDMKEYEHWLLQATRFDPWFPDAANEAAGYLRLRVSTIEEAGLLRAAALANPGDGLAAVALAQLCLEHGAYGGAAGILEIESVVLQTRRPSLPYDTLLADLILAFWGSGQIEAAESVYARRQQALDFVLREEIDRKGALVSLARRKEMQLPPTPSIITNTAAMLVARKMDGAEIVTANTDSAFKLAIQASEEAKVPTDQIASLWLERAFVALWLGGSVEDATTSIASAVALQPVSPMAQARFDGWFAYRAGDFARAEALFAPLAESDPSANIGLAMALESLGRVRDAATQFLGLAKTFPATAIGLFARESLWRLLGNKVPLLPDAAELDAIASLPSGFRKIVEDPGGALLLTIQPRAREVEMFMPLQFDFVITNRGDWPIAIAPNGPLRDTATAACTVSMSGQLSTRIPPYEAVSLSTRLGLAPGESVVATYDATIGDGTRTFKYDPTVGGFASVHGILNWRTTATGMEPGPLGIEVESDTVRVEGVRVDSAWVTRAIAEISDSSKPPSPVTVAFLACAVARAEARSASLAAATIDALAGAETALLSAISRLTPVEVAWVAAQVPPARKSLTTFYAAVDAIPDALIRTARMTAQPDFPDDVLIELTLRDGPLEVQSLARALHDHREGILLERRENLDISK